VAMKQRFLMIVIMLSQFEKINETSNGIGIFHARAMRLENGSQIFTKLIYYGHHPPEAVIGKQKYRCDIEFHEKDGDISYVLVNDKEKRGPSRFEPVEPDSQETTTKIEKTEKKEWPEKSVHQLENNQTVLNALHTFKNADGPEKLKCIVLLKSAIGETDLVEQGKLGQMLPVDLFREYFPQQLDDLVEVPAELLIENITDLTLKHTRSNDPEEIKRIKYDIAANKQLLNFINDKLGIDTDSDKSENQDDQLTEEEVIAAIEQKNQERAAEPDDLTNVPNVGPKTAEKLVEAGYTKIHQLAYPENLNGFEHLVETVGSTTADKIHKAARQYISDIRKSQEKLENKVAEIQKTKEKTPDPPQKEEIEQATQSLVELQQHTEVEPDVEKLEELAIDLKFSITRALTRINSLNYVPGFRTYRASWSSTKPRKIILLKHWPKYLNAEQRKTREEILELNGKYMLSGAKIGTIIHEHVEVSRQFEKNILDEGWELVAKEQVVSVPVEHPDGGLIQLVGHVDAIYQHIETGQKIVVDYKTRKSEMILKLWNGVQDRYTEQFYPKKVQDNFKQLIVYQHWAGKQPGALIEFGRNKGEVNHQFNEYDPELWESQKRFWFDIATIETKGELPPHCSEDPLHFPCSWGEGKTQQRCQFFGFCWEEYL